MAISLPVIVGDKRKLNHFFPPILNGSQTTFAGLNDNSYPITGVSLADALRYFWKVKSASVNMAGSFHTGGIFGETFNVNFNAFCTAVKKKATVLTVPQTLVEMTDQRDLLWISKPGGNPNANFKMRNVGLIGSGTFTPTFTSIVQPPFPPTVSITALGGGIGIQAFHLFWRDAANEDHWIPFINIALSVSWRVSRASTFPPSRDYFAGFQSNRSGSFTPKLTLEGYEIPLRESVPSLGWSKLSFSAGMTLDSEWTYP